MGGGNSLLATKERGKRRNLFLGGKGWDRRIPEKGWDVLNRNFPFNSGGAMAGGVF